MDEMNLMPWREVKARYQRKSWAMFAVGLMLVSLFFTQLFPKEQVVVPKPQPLVPFHLRGLIKDGRQVQAMLTMPNGKPMVVKVGQKVGPSQLLIKKISKKGVLFANGQLVVLRKKEWV